MQDAHLEISRISEARGFDESPRTTLVACVVQDGIAYWAHAGDARLYLLRDGRIHSRTRDHTRVGQLVEQGLLDPDKARDHPDRSKVFSCLGGSLAPQIDYSHKIALMPGDTLALCTDGLSGPLSDTTLIDTLTRLADGCGAGTPRYRRGGRRRRRRRPDPDGDALAGCSHRRRGGRSPAMTTSCVPLPMYAGAHP